MAKLKNAVNLSKIKFSAYEFFMHICNISETNLQRIKNKQQKP